MRRKIGEEEWNAHEDTAGGDMMNLSLRETCRGMESFPHFACSQMEEDSLQGGTSRQLRRGEPKGTARFCRKNLKFFSTALSNWFVKLVYVSIGSMKLSDMKTATMR